MQDFSCHLLVNIWRLADLYWVAHQQFQARICELKTCLWARHLHLNIDMALDGMVLAFDLLSILRIDRVYGCPQLPLRCLMISVRRNHHHDLVPCVLGSWNLLEERCARLEKNGI